MPVDLDKLLFPAQHLCVTWTLGNFFLGVPETELDGISRLLKKSIVLVKTCLANFFRVTHLYPDQTLFRNMNASGSNNSAILLGNQVFHSAAVSNYGAKNTTHTYVDQSEQVSASAMTTQRTANLGNASKVGAAGGQTNIYASTYSGALADGNNGNTDVHKLKFDINAQGNNDQIYTSIDDVPPGLRNTGSFHSNLVRHARNVGVFGTAALSAAVDGSTASDLNTDVVQSHPAEDVVTDTSVGASASGSQGATALPPNGDTLTWGLAL